MCPQSRLLVLRVPKPKMRLPGLRLPLLRTAREPCFRAWKNADSSVLGKAPYAASAAACIF